MTRFRPCIDLHAGQVKQIVGGSLTDSSETLRTNHTSTLPSAHFATLYRQHNLTGAHVIKLGPGNDEAAEEALAAWPNALQIGGGITALNANNWIERGAAKVIVTSALFPAAKFSLSSLEAILANLGGDVTKLVIDLSCRRRPNSSSSTESTSVSAPQWIVAMNKWQTATDMILDAHAIRLLEPYCSEFLIHAADNEGLQGGIDEDLVLALTKWCSLPVTYAGGARGLDDLDRVRDLSGGKVDLTIGSALDIFGGTGVGLSECVAWNQAQALP